MDTKEVQKQCNIGSGHKISANPKNLSRHLDKKIIKLLCCPENERIIDGKGIVYLEGDTGCESYVLLEGELEVKKSMNGAQKTVATLKPRNLFGELALFKDIRRNATVYSKSKAKIAKIDRRTFQKIINENPEVALYFLKLFADRYVDKDDSISY